MAKPEGEEWQLPKTLRQQRLKQPLDGSTGSPRRLPRGLSHPPPQRLDVSINSTRRLPPPASPKYDKLKFGCACIESIVGFGGGARQGGGGRFHAAPPNDSASKLSNRFSTCLSPSDILPRRDSTRATTPANATVGATRQGLTRALSGETSLLDVATDGIEESPLPIERLRQQTLK